MSSLLVHRYSRHGRACIIHDSTARVRLGPVQGAGIPTAACRTSTTVPAAGAASMASKAFLLVLVMGARSSTISFYYVHLDMRRRAEHIVCHSADAEALPHLASALVTSVFVLDPETFAASGSIRARWPSPCRCVVEDDLQTNVRRMSERRAMNAWHGVSVIGASAVIWGVANPGPRSATRSPGGALHRLAHARSQLRRAPRRPGSRWSTIHGPRLRRRAD
jgi:hypothetical protein